MQNQNEKRETPRAIEKIEYRADCEALRLPVTASGAGSDISTCFYRCARKEEL
jgi:hypothetical protein